MRGIFVDLETTGRDASKHVVLDICVAVVDMTSCDNIAQYHSCITCSADDWLRSEPKALQVNGFDESALIQGKSIERVSYELLGFLVNLQLTRYNSFFMCQNPTFDKPFFDKIITLENQENYDMPYHWLDLASMYWIVKGVGNIGDINLSKDAIARNIGRPIEEMPHRATNGVRHLIECYKVLKEISL